MTLLQPSPAPAVTSAAGSGAHARVAELQARIQGMEAPLRPTRQLPLRADLAGLLPSGLREGAAYRVLDSPALAIALVAEASAAGRWVGWVGWPWLGAEALAAAGVRLERSILVPQPGRHWLTVASALADALSIVVLRPPRGLGVSAGDASRFAARLRERGSTLLVDGPWPSAEAELRVERQHWLGVAAGRGLVQAQQVQVVAQDRSGRIRRGLLDATAASVTQSFETPEELRLDWAVSA